MKTNFNNFFKNNSSTILTIAGSIGVGITAIMSARDTIKAVKRIDETKVTKTKEKIKVAAPCYIPTIITGVSTVLCICSANKINKDVQKSLASAYILLDKSFKEYRSTVNDIYGEDGDSTIVKHIVDEKVEELYPVEQDDIVFDFYSLQFFNTDLQMLYEAEKEINKIFQTVGYVSLETVHSLIGEDILETDKLLGWSIGAGRIYGYDRVEFDITPMHKEDGTKYHVLDYCGQPTDDYLIY